MVGLGHPPQAFRIFKCNWFRLLINGILSTVGPRNSCGMPVVLEQSTEAFSATNRFSTSTIARIADRKQQNVALALVISLLMKVLHELGQGTS